MSSPRLRVLQCITRLGLGGAERVACTLVEELPAEFEVAVFTVYGADADGAAQAQRASLERRGARWFPGTRLPLTAGGMVTGGLALAPVAEGLARRPPPDWQLDVRPPAPGLTGVFPDFDLVVMPSRFEGLPLVAVEAALTGLPVVAADAPGLREALPAAQPWRYPPGDPAALAAALSDALAQTNLWEGVARAARAMALERFDPARFAAAYTQLYREAAALPAGSRRR